MQSVLHHPYVSYQVDQGPDPGSLMLTFQCMGCGNVWRKECQFPERIPVWVNRYAAEHAHDPGLRQHFARQFHLAVQQQRM